jgi:hypothetical protein
MERRFWYGLGVLAMLLVLGLWTAWGMEKLNQPVADALEQAAQAAVGGDMAQGMALAERAQNHWCQNRGRMTAVADHGPLEEIDSLFAQVQIYADTGKTADFAAYCTRLAKLVTAVGEAHGLNWQNLL